MGVSQVSWTESTITSQGWQLNCRPKETVFFLRFPEFLEPRNSIFMSKEKVGLWLDISSQVDIFWWCLDGVRPDRFVWRTGKKDCAGSALCFHWCSRADCWNTEQMKDWEVLVCPSECAFHWCHTGYFSNIWLEHSCFDKKTTRSCFCSALNCFAPKYWNPLPRRIIFQENSSPKLELFIKNKPKCVDGRSFQLPFFTVSAQMLSFAFFQKNSVINEQKFACTQCLHMPRLGTCSFDSIWKVNSLFATRPGWKSCFDFYLSFSFFFS